MTHVFAETPPARTESAIIFPDPLTEGLAIVRSSTILAAHGVRHIGTETPDSLGDDFPGLPYVSLSYIDTNTRQHPFFEKATLQVSVWGETKGKGLRVAQLGKGVLTAFEGDERVGSVRAGQGPFSGTDPDTAWPLAYFTVTLRLQPELVTVPIP